MESPPQSLRLTELIVEALGVGTGKRELDVIDALFATFSLNFAGIEAQVPLATPDRARELQAVAAASLAAAAPHSAALINALLRHGGHFLAIVREVYSSLARHAATTTGTSESFQLARSELDEDGLTLSPAFIEQIRRLVERLRTVSIGRFDLSGLGHFLSADNGEFYGRWPPESTDYEGRLADAVLSLAWLDETWLSQFDANNPRLSAARVALAEADSAARALTTAPETIIEAYVVNLDHHADLPIADLCQLIATAPLDDWEVPRLAAEIERFRSERIIGTSVGNALVSDVDALSLVGLNAQLTPVVVSIESYAPASGVGHLAGFVSQRRSGKWPRRSRDRLEPRLADLDEAVHWLTWVRDAATAAVGWLEHAVFVPTGNIDELQLEEYLEEFLNLPLWRARELLYEIWVLTTTLAAAESAGWTATLTGLTEQDGVWVLGAGAGTRPVASLCGTDPRLHLDVWREPDRRTAFGRLTPDVTIATPGPRAQDLLVVEAKDRIKMSAGSTFPTANPSKHRALDVATRYADALRPRAAWIVNHCEFRVPVDPNANHGDPWQHIHAADRFRPHPHAAPGTTGLICA